MNFYNLQLFQLMNDIRDLIVKAQLPAGMVYYMLQNLTIEIEQLYNESVQQEFRIFKENNENIANSLQEKIETAPLHFTEIIENENDNEEAGQE